MELELKIGGIGYLVEVDIDDDYVISVFEVSVFDGEMSLPIDMNKKDLEDFYERYEDDLNEAYQSHKIALAESCAEERWEQAREEGRL